MTRAQILAFLACCCMGFNVFAQNQCGAPQAPWSCFGLIELQYANEAAHVTLRMLRFSNGEFMAEIEQGATKKQYLEVQPSGLGLFSGLTESESLDSVEKNPFAFFDMPFVWPLMSLQAAYPSGLEAVPWEETRTDVVVEENQPVAITAVRVAPVRMEFRLRFEQNPDLKVEGLWDGQLLKPLPDDYSVVDWKHRTASKIADLGEARALDARGAAMSGRGHR